MARSKILIVLVIVGMLAGTLVAFQFLPEPSPIIDTEGVAVTWDFDTGGIIQAPAVLADVDGDSQIEAIVASQQGLFAINPIDGAEEWSQTQLSLADTPSIGSLNDDAFPDIVTRSEGGSIHVINGRNGSILWSSPIRELSFVGELAEDEMQRYHVMVEPHAVSMRLILDCGNNDFDLYVGYDYEPSLDDYDYIGYTGSGEDITIQYPEAGTWHVMVHAYDGSGEFTLGVTIEYADDTGYQNFQFQGNLANQGDMAYHSLMIPENVISANFYLDCGSNDFDLYGGLNYTPSLLHYDFRGYNEGHENLTIEGISPGNWTLMVHSYSGTGFYRLTVTVRVDLIEGMIGAASVRPIVADMNGDGIEDIIVGTSTGYIYCLEGATGNPIWERPLDKVAEAPYAITDLNGDSIPDIVAPLQTGWIYALDGTNGETIWVNGIAVPRTRGVLMADVNQDSIEDAILSADDMLVMLDGKDGSVIGRVNFEESGVTAPSATQLNIPGLELWPGGEQGEFSIVNESETSGLGFVIGGEQGDLFVVDAETMQVVETFNVVSAIETAPSTADVNGDGILDLVFSTSNGRVVAIDIRVSEIIMEMSLPVSTNGYQSILDIDGNGALDLVVTYESGYVYSFEIQNSGTRVMWQGGGGDSSGDSSLLRIDSDQDLLSTYSEGVIGSSTRSNDTDLDTIIDSIELMLGLSPLLPDSDFDSLDDYSETYIYHTSGANPDSDYDMLSDADEILVYFTNPLSNDTELDGLIDGLEILVYGSSPFLSDSDSDTIPDADEVLIYGSSPASSDTDQDTIPDFDEIFRYGTNPNATDSDFDGLSDAEEIILYHTSPLNPDTDSDAASDGFEIDTMGTDPLNFDSDADSYPDLWEYNAGFDPLDGHVPIEEPVLFYGPFAMIIGFLGVLIVSYRKFGWTLPRRKPKEETKGIPETVSNVVETVDEPVHDLLDGVDKPWLYDGRPPLIRAGDIQDVMQWLVKEENYANALIDGGSLREGVERLEKILEYLDKEQEMLRENLDAETLERIWLRISNRIDEVREVLN